MNKRNQQWNSTDLCCQSLGANFCKHSEGVGIAPATEAFFHAVVAEIRMCDFTGSVCYPLIVQCRSSATESCP